MPARTEQLQRSVVSMTDTLRHRGPDDAGTFIEAGSGIALGTRRLSIIDLSAAGHQPMQSAGGRYVVSYNGEIYNFAELRDELEAFGHRFRGSSDTEVLVTAVEHWGLRSALARCNGMFGLAVWDRHDRQLHLARDRFGEKPLYYGWAGGVFLFGSELKALRAHSAFEAPIDRDVLTLYLRHNCVPAPFTIYKGIAKLPPGMFLTIGASTAPRTLPDPEPYWSLRDVAEAGAADRLTGPEDAVLGELDAVLRDAVAIRMTADVPLGAFLSGGIDSSLVVGLMQAQSTAKVKTFTISFEDAGYDEADHARRVAKHLGTEHHELLMTAADALEVIPQLPAIYDEPFADSSQIPTSVLARLTRDHVTVAMSGDGGDELFGGYNRYAWAERFWSKIEPVPRPLRRWAGEVVGAVPPQMWDAAARRAGRLLPSSLDVRLPGMKIQKAARVLPAADLHETYVMLASHAQEPERLVLGAREPRSLLTRPSSWPSSATPLELMMYLDSMTYLPDDILTKLDRATMAASLESRLPFLDHRVAALSWRLGPELKVRGGTGKWLLRRLLHRYVPADLVERPKAGFGVPLGDWLRGPLRPWAEELLDRQRLERDGYLAAAPVRRMWRQHLSGRHDHQYGLWDVLMLQAWLESTGS